MPVTATELRFVIMLPDGTEGRKAYPAGTPVAFCPPGTDDEGFYLTRRVKELTEANREPYRIVLLDGIRRLLPQRIIVNAAADAA